MITATSKTLFVKLLIALFISLYVSQVARAQDLDDESIQRIFEFSEDLTKQTDKEFSRIYDYLPQEFTPEQKKTSLKIYLSAKEQISEGKIQDPHYPETFEGKVSSRVKVPGGNFEVTWIAGKPLIIIGIEKYRGLSVFVPEEIDQKSTSFRRFLYHQHIFSGDSGYGVWDHLEPKKGLLSWFTKFRKKNFVRGSDINIITHDSKGEILANHLSRRPKWLSASWWQEYFKAMTLGRPVTFQKILSAAGIAVVPTLVTYSFVNIEMAAVIAGFTLITQANYEAYLTYKFTNSNFMQVVKLSIVSAITNLTYIGLHYGADTSPELILHAFKNAALGVYVFHSWRINKQLLLESGKTVGDAVLIPSMKFSLPFAKSITTKAFKMNKAKIHDTLTDQFPGLARQFQLAWELNPMMMVAVAMVGHGYAYALYGWNRMGELKNTAIERLMDEVFYKKMIRTIGSKIKKTCNELYQYVLGTKAHP